MFRSRFLWICLAMVLQVLSLPSQGFDLEEIARRYTKLTAGGLHLPIVPREARSLERRAGDAAIGLGDFLDVAYTVLMKIGGIMTPLLVDTGSSDLWVMSDACIAGCSGVPVYPQSTFRYSGVDARLLYGDSTTHTYASGMVGDDTVNLAGLAQENHFFAAINSTDTSLNEYGEAGIFGLGFAMNSFIWEKLFSDVYSKSGSPSRREEEPTSERVGIKMGSPFPNLHNFRRAKFPSLFGEPSRRQTRQTQSRTSAVMYSIFASYHTIAPFVPRLVATSSLGLPMFTISLQRNTIDVGGNIGMLSIGELPSGIPADNMTWVPLRMYSYSEGGPPAPPDSPNETYPIAWEVMLGGVYLDGQKLPQSNLSSPTIQLSALVDTGNSLLRGPPDIVELIYNKIGSRGIFPCSEPHTIAFEIGGKMFPVDPRDFASQAFNNDVQRCAVNLVATDTPSVGGYLFSWSLGVPFLKSVLSSYYYGNMSYPSQDLPKMGFLSTVPDDASDKMKSAVAAAASANGNFPAISQPAPSGTDTSPTQVPQATPSNNQANTNSSRRTKQLELSNICGAFITLLLVAWSIPDFFRV